ncbi:hypothetical protein [Spongiactinospora sp. TRM90649]|uniref:hypothetical protein n=1 Tax=Spongiactinospora sp. TRM90649 TaxID=3031114 RepID=UPI0023F9B973|nr:hypothetical protein [Spongiactinospora sp. TRM90649]MDF5752762.1 hypothetical protein [Spongiactinospora sp. TRM90649]
MGRPGRAGKRLAGGHHRAHLVGHTADLPALREPVASFYTQALTALLTEEA